MPSAPFSPLVCPRQGGAQHGPGTVFISQRGQTGYRIAGTARDANGNPLAGATVMVFRTDRDTLHSKVVADPGGIWSCGTPDSTTRFYALYYKAGAPDIAGTTVNTLVGS